MKAVLCKEFGGPEVLQLGEVDEPSVGPGQVLIDVRACAINFPDLLMIQDMYQFKPGLPFVPGSEVSGVVRAVGDGVESVSVGDLVIGSSGTVGGLAERVAVPHRQVHLLPSGATPAESAGLLYAYGTAHHALKDRARLEPGESLVVLGAAGAVGLAAVEIGRIMGARVIAAASTDEKLAACRHAGADETINYSSEDLKTRIRELTDGAGADVVYDPVGGPYSEPALRSTAWKGRFLVIGFAAGDIPRLPLNLTMLRGCSIVGVFWGLFVAKEADHHWRNVEELIGWWRDGRLRPHVSATYPLERAGDALRELAERRVVGKVVVTLGDQRSTPTPN